MSEHRPEQSDHYGESLVEPEDLAWWLLHAPTLEWTEAKTYASTAPHEYVVLKRIPGLSRADFVRAAHVIHTFGEPGRFYNSTNIYLAHGRHRWWTMDADLRDTDLINRAVNDRVYGLQDAPKTYNAAFTDYDARAVDYDRAEHDRGRDEELRRQVIEHFGEDPAHRPVTLDVGCGTGRVLDLGLTSPDNYTGVDPSQAMLNRLVMKHPRVRRLLPARIEEIPNGLLAPRYDLVVALDMPGLSPDTIDRLRGLGTLLILA